MDQEYTTTKDVAKMLRVTPEYVRRLVRKGILHPEKVVNTYIYDKYEVSRYIEDLEFNQYALDE